MDGNVVPGVVDGASGGVVGGVGGGPRGEPAGRVEEPGGTAKLEFGDGSSGPRVCETVSRTVFMASARNDCNLRWDSPRFEAPLGPRSSGVGEPSGAEAAEPSSEPFSACSTPVFPQPDVRTTAINTDRGKIMTQQRTGFFKLKACQPHVHMRGFFSMGVTNREAGTLFVRSPVLRGE